MVEQIYTFCPYCLEKLQYLTPHKYPSTYMCKGCGILLSIYRDCIEFKNISNWKHWNHFKTYPNLPPYEMQYYNSRIDRDKNLAIFCSDNGKCIKFTRD